MDDTEKIIPIRYKVLGIVFCILTLCAVSLFYFSFKTFADDKRLFVGDLNTTLLRSIVSDMKLELKYRLEGIQAVVQRIYPLRSGANAVPTPPAAAPVAPTEGQPAPAPPDPFAGLAGNLADEVISISLYRPNANKAFDRVFLYQNAGLFSRRQLPDNLVDQITTQHPIKIEDAKEQEVRLTNRSVRFAKSSNAADVAVLTLMFRGNFLFEEQRDTVIVVDLIQDFLTKTLQASDLAEAFLISQDGLLISHPQHSLAVQFAGLPFNHPITQKVEGKPFPRDLIELPYNDDIYLMNVMETGFPGILAVAQTRKSIAFAPMNSLLQKSILIFIIFLAVGVFLSTLFTAGMTFGARQLKEAAELVGTGQFTLKLNVKSRDEIGSVAGSFQWMANRLGAIVDEKIKTALMVQQSDLCHELRDTILLPTPTEGKAFSIFDFVSSGAAGTATFREYCAKDNVLMILVGEAQEIGVMGDITASLTKSLFKQLVTLTTVLPRVEDTLNFLNTHLFEAFKGKHAVALNLVRLNLSTGELTTATAGMADAVRHHKGTKGVISSVRETDKDHGDASDTPWHGDLLGAKKDGEFVLATEKIEIADTIGVFTTGFSEAMGVEDGLLSLLSALGGVERNPKAVQMQLESEMHKRARELTHPREFRFVYFTWKAVAETGSKQLKKSVTTTQLAREKESRVDVKAAKTVHDTKDFEEELEKREAFLFEGKEGESLKRALQIQKRHEKERHSSDPNHQNT